MDNRLYHRYYEATEIRQICVQGGEPLYEVYLDDQTWKHTHRSMPTVGIPGELQRKRLWGEDWGFRDWAGKKTYLSLYTLWSQLNPYHVHVITCNFVF